LISEIILKFEFQEYVKNEKKKIKRQNSKLSQPCIPEARNPIKTKKWKEFSLNYSN